MNQKGMCKVHITAGLKGMRVLTEGNRWFIVQLLVFLLVLHVPAVSWCDVLASPTAVVTKSIEELSISFSLARAGKLWEQLPLWLGFS